MKNVVLMIVFTAIIGKLFAQDQVLPPIVQEPENLGIVASLSKSEPAAVDPNQVSQAEIIILRNTGISGSAVRFRSFLGNQLLGKIRNKRFDIYLVPAGNHEFSVQFSGKNKKAKGFNIVVEPGKKYYIMMVLKYGWFVNKLYAVEVIESSALRQMEGLKPMK